MMSALAALKTVFAGCILCIGSTSCVSQVSDDERDLQPPNIIVILSDDHRSDFLGLSGHTVIETPNIDDLASRGIYFTNAFVTSASCTPSRTSILTGQYERKHGVTFGSNSALSDAAFQRTYPMVLKQNGYFVGYIGKNHVPAGHSDIGFGYNSGLFESAFDFWYGNHGHSGFYPKAKHPIYESAKSDTQIEIFRDAALGFLRGDGDFANANPDLPARPKDQPFALLVNFNVPHANSTNNMEQRPTDPELYRTRYRDDLDQIVLPETYVAYDDIEVPKLPKDIYENDYIDSYRYAKKPETLIEHNLKEIQTITGVDAFIGTVLETLKEQGLEENTIILFSSDHGVQHGEHGLGGKMLLYEQSTRVPFIVYDPRKNTQNSGTKSDELVLNIDISPTLLNLAGVPIPDSVQGESLVPLMDGEDAPEWRKDFFMENLFTGQGYPRFEGIRNERYKYVRYFDPAKNQPHKYALTATIEGEQPVYEELYDLQNDPLEQKNLASDPDHETILESMRQRSREMLLEAKGGITPPDTYSAE